MKKRAARIVKRNLGRLDIGHKIFENSLVVFIYHEISNHPSPFMEEHNLNVKPALFVQHMDFIRHNFNIIDPDQLLAGQYKKPAAMITFDDGMKSYFQNALPIMSERNISSINFLNVATIEGDVSWTGLISYLTRYDRNFCDMIRRHDSRQTENLDFTLYPPNVVEDYISTLDLDLLKEKLREYTDALADREDLEAV